jgi:arylsulfatase A-like enzyme
LDRPNILWICTDQQRWDTLGCYGNEFVRTPVVDRLAEDGVIFDYCYSQSSVCTPSRTSFLTGRYPRTCRGRQNGADIPADEVLITKVLADAGYICGLSGKLHLSTCHPSAQPGTERRIDDGYSVFHWSHDASLLWPANEYGLWLKEKGIEYEPQPYEDSPHVSAGYPAEHHQTTWCVEKAISFLDSAADFDMPWLFSVNIYDPHHPFDPPIEYLERYLDHLDDIPLPNYVEGELDGKPPFQRTDHGQGGYAGVGPEFGEAAMTDGDHRLTRAAYWAMCDLVDEQVGRLLDALEQSGQAGNTLVIFTSDHGELLGDHGIYWKGPFFYEPAVRVPLIVRLPGTIPAGRRSCALVELSDLAPTILDAASVAHPPGMQARSFWPMLTDEADLDEHRDDVYSEYYNSMPFHRDPTAQVTMVRTRHHKIVAAHGTGTGELYDLDVDPNETDNLWDDPGSAALKLRMYERLTDRMAWTVDPLPLRQADW